MYLYHEHKRIREINNEHACYMHFYIFLHKYHKVFCTFVDMSELRTPDIEAFIF
jgi:hypothetical protein